MAGFDLHPCQRANGDWVRCYIMVLFDANLLIALGHHDHEHHAATTTYRPTSPGWMSVIHTGMRGGHESRSLDFHGNLAAGVIALAEPAQGFPYVGEIASLPAFSGTGSNAWEREALARNLIGTLTTKSNSFGVWGVGHVGCGRGRWR